MKTFISIMFAASIILSVPGAGVASTPVFEQEIAEHGGGCRKSSPPGMCCHMDRKAGTVHCH